MTHNPIEAFTELLTEKMKTKRGKHVQDATSKDLYYVIASIVNDKVHPHWLQTQETYNKKQPKQVFYLSMEFLVGRLLESNLLNCGLHDICTRSLKKLGFDPSEVYAQEHDAGLGNGGLGRLAACFLDSLASLSYPGHGYGIRYRYGLFEQKIIQDYQVEIPDYWLTEEYPWETRRADEAFIIHFNGEVLTEESKDGSLEFSYIHTDQVRAIPYDIPIVGYNNQVVNSLRLWSAESPKQEDEFFTTQNARYYHHLDHKNAIEQISGFLYPDDSSNEGKELRLKQQYFLVSASIQNIIMQYKKTSNPSLHHFHEFIAIQINDTHPSLAVPELMRILMDEEKFGWDKAWEITTKTIAYTNHTTLSEALEKWPKTMLQGLLPRIYMIINEINERFCQGIWFDHPELRDKIPELAIIADEQVHMAHLAIVGSFSVNGVARIHTEILKKKEMKSFYQLYPAKFNNKTNGITHRRWLLQVNPNLANLVTEVIGPSWIQRPKQLISLLRHSKDKPFLEKVDQVKHQNKQALAKYIKDKTGILVDDQSIFDVQIKRLHEYKRQLLNIFHVIYLYNELKENPNQHLTPRTFIFGAKAAPSYHLAKEVIKLINKVGNIINNDVDVRDRIKVVFLENYNVSLAEKIIPAADISEQISTASKEASGTGNMKLMMNGALTVGTLDGANIEIRDLVGDSNIFIFGLNADEVLNYYQFGGYSAKDIYQTDERIRKILDQLFQGVFGSNDLEFKDLYYHMLYHNDPYFVLKDFDSYIDTHEFIEQSYRDKTNWLTKSVTNIAYSGKFSSDRTIQEYASEIWNIRPIKR
ncbi:glycogen/starch/alpha-glucan phosphorylase [Bacillus solitudinis]|uniref:glycogen/starch/alpha-glucan phosphorylase n=1 Tax=Bacillus solitudinis TaxID=2014074 RepID=UPI000C25107C|nr:glycogen/starch/alpha-glucan phosphorylase [Bacillus solitudinis]